MGSLLKVSEALGNIHLESIAHINPSSFMMMTFYLEWCKLKLGKPPCPRLIFFGPVMSPHSDQMSQRSQVSRIAP